MLFPEAVVTILPAENNQSSSPRPPAETIASIPDLDPDP
jgi:hypothetical protein